VGGKRERGAARAFIASVIAIAFGFWKALGTGMMSPVSCCALSRSADSASPALVLPRLRGKTIRRDLYSLRRCELSCSDSFDLLRRRWSTAMPIERASFRLIPASFSSVSVKPRPSRSL